MATLTRLPNTSSVTTDRAALAVVAQSAGNTDLSSTGPGSRALPLCGQLVAGRYQVEALLGEGGMGAVYRAEHVSLCKPVALKVLHPDLSALPEVVARFRREAVLSARIQHPNVVTATDCGQLETGPLFLVLEYVPGLSLRQVLEQEGRLPCARALEIAAQVAEALGAAHAAGVVHRDLKPENVMLMRSAPAGTPEETLADSVKVLDFGIAKAFDVPAGELKTRHGAVFGTPEYMSPEQARGHAVDQRADIYSLGILLYELLSGTVPFRASDAVAVLVQHVQATPEPLPDLALPAVQQLVMKLLAKAPDDRPSNAVELAAQLRALARDALASSPPRSSRTRAPSTASAGATVAPWHEQFKDRLAARLSSERGLRGALLLGGLLTFALMATLVRLERHEGPETPGDVLADTPQAAAGYVDSAKAGDPTALAILLTTDPGDRSDPQWLALSAGLQSASRHGEALQSLEQALDFRPRLAEDRTFLAQVRLSADQPDTRDDAMKLAATRLGPRGADLLFDVWASTGAKTPATRAAKRWLDEPEVRRVADEPLSLVLALRDTSSCEAIAKLLPRIERSGDARSVRRLQRLNDPKGCGVLGLRDCYPCLRSGDQLERALAAARARPGPSFR